MELTRALELEEIQKMLWLREFGGLSASEIAFWLKCPERTVLHYCQKHNVKIPPSYTIREIDKQYVPEEDEDGPICKGKPYSKLLLGELVKNLKKTH